MASPSPAQIETVREIAHLSNRTDAAFYLGRLNDAEWNATVEDIAEWAKVKNKHTVIKGGGVEINKSQNRLDVTNRVRGRFGLKSLDENGRVVQDAAFDEDEGTHSVDVYGVF